jgi:hypothetical protein
MDEVQTVGIWLIKKLCKDTNATTASLTIDLTHHGKPDGKYKITVEEITPLNN